MLKQLIYSLFMGLLINKFAYFHGCGSSHKFLNLRISYKVSKSGLKDFYVHSDSDLCFDHFLIVRPLQVASSLGVTSLASIPLILVATVLFYHHQ